MSTPGKPIFGRLRSLNRDFPNEPNLGHNIKKTQSFMAPRRTRRINESYENYFNFRQHMPGEAGTPKKSGSRKDKVREANMKKSAFALTLCILLGGLSLSAEFSDIELRILRNLVRWVREIGAVAM